MLLSFDAGRPLALEKTSFPTLLRLASEEGQTFGQICLVVFRGEEAGPSFPLYLRPSLPPRPPTKQERKSARPRLLFCSLWLLGLFPPSLRHKSKKVAFHSKFWKIRGGLKACGFFRRRLLYGNSSSGHLPHRFLYLVPHRSRCPQAVSRRREITFFGREIYLPSPRFASRVPFSPSDNSRHYI